MTKPNIIELFLRDMLADSALLECEHELGQAFDKIARAIESLLPNYLGKYQTDKASALFASDLANDQIWSNYSLRPTVLTELTSDLTYYVATDDKNALRKLTTYGEGFERAVQRANRNEAANNLGKWFMLLRNKRFHGDPGFSGQNIRLARKMELLLPLLRQHIEIALHMHK